MSRENRCLKIYLEEISKSKPLKRAEEIALAEEYQRSGCSKSLDKLIKANLAYCVNIASKFQNRGISLSDIIQAGNIGIVKAAQKYRPELGYKFGTSAIWYISREIRNSLNSGLSQLTIPYGQPTDNMLRVKQAYYRFIENDNTKNPTIDDIRNLLEGENRIRETATQKVSDRFIKSIIIAMAPATRLDQPLEDDGSLYDCINIPSNLTEDVTDEVTVTEIYRAVSSLPQNESYIITEYFSDKNQTLKTIGNTMGLTRERVRQLRNRALKRLKKKMDILQIVEA